MEDASDADADPQHPESEAAEAHYVWQFFSVTNSTDPKKGGSKNACCMFCEKSFSGCSTARAAAHILARPVMGQSKAGIQSCVAINKKDDDSTTQTRIGSYPFSGVPPMKVHSSAVV